jgi:hypothetical protein
MAVISKAVYESLAEKVGNSYAAQLGSIPYIASGLAEVVALDDNDQEYDLLFTWYNVNAGASAQFSATYNFIPLAASINTHAELRSGKTLTQYLTDEAITVTSDFAIVSKAAGWDVDAFIA